MSETLIPTKIGPGKGSLGTATGLGKPVFVRDKHDRYGPKVRVGDVVDEVSTLRDGTTKYCLQQIASEPKVQQASGSDLLYRVFYYTLAADGVTIRHAQYGPIMTPAEVRALLREARNRGWPGFEPSQNHHRK